MVRIGRCASGLAVASALVASCGGSSRHAPPAPPPGSSLSAVAVSPDEGTLPVSVNGPTVCTVYDAVYATQVMFASRTLDVRSECQTWAQGRPGEGYLWGYQPAAAADEPTDSIQVCALEDTHGHVAARVVEATGFRPVSRAEAARGSSACMSLKRVGWIEATRPAPARPPLLSRTGR
ncbi:MAG TPA: hypothetical protein VMU39_09730 [Solirubrobacteraceae bacterium]|nr:hypothetical protein [Solirubrobacteraceae bacterium]